MNVNNLCTVIDTAVYNLDIHQNDTNVLHVLDDDNPKVFYSKIDPHSIIKWSSQLTNTIDYNVVFSFVFHNHMEQWSMFVHMHMLHPLYVYMDNIDHDDIH